PRRSSVIARRPSRASAAAVPPHAWRVWPPPCRNSTGGASGSPRASARSVRPSAPANECVRGAKGWLGRDMLYSADSVGGTSDSMDYQNLRYEVADGVATIALDRPGAANAIDLALARELMQVAIRCDEDPRVRAVLLTGVGRMSSVGGALKAFAAHGDALPSLLKEITTNLHAATSRWARMAAPLVVAVNGTAAGAGFSLAIAGDLVVMAESAKLTMA